MTGAPITFAAVARPVAAHGWRPFPGLQTSKTPAMKHWSLLNDLEWDAADLVAAISDYQPIDDYCCCLAVQPEIVAIDADIIDQDHAAFADRLADDILGKTPLLRIGLAPKQIRIYRAGDPIKSRKLHPLEIFCGTGQFIGFGWHAKADRPYIWPQESPLTINTDSNAIPLVTRAKLDRFTSELFKVVPRRMSPTRQSRPGAGAPQTISERLRILTALHGSWQRAAAIVLSEASEGCHNETLWAVVTSAAGRGVPENVIWELVEKHFSRDSKVSEAKVASDLASMIERARPVLRQPPVMYFI
ncbi:MAG: hypothetical protein ACLQF4_11305 [Xanthobacteraceae bacterium]